MIIWTQKEIIQDRNWIAAENNDISSYFKIVNAQQNGKCR